MFPPNAAYYLPATNHTTGSIRLWRSCGYRTHATTTYHLTRLLYRHTHYWRQRATRAATRRVCGYTAGRAKCYLLPVMGFSNCALLRMGSQRNATHHCLSPKRIERVAILFLTVEHHTPPAFTWWRLPYVADGTWTGARHTRLHRTAAGSTTVLVGRSGRAVLFWYTLFARRLRAALLRFARPTYYAADLPATALHPHTPHTPGYLMTLPPPPPVAPLPIIERLKRTTGSHS